MVNKLRVSMGLSFKLPHGSKYFELGQREQMRVTHALLQKLVEIFPKKVRDPWARIDPDDRGFPKVPAKAHIPVPQLRTYIDRRVSELDPFAPKVANPPPRRFTLCYDEYEAEGGEEGADGAEHEHVPEHEKGGWICTVKGDTHICEPVYCLCLDEEPFLIATNSSEGEIRSEVVVRMWIDTPLPTHEMAETEHDHSAHGDGSGAHGTVTPPKPARVPTPAPAPAPDGRPASSPVTGGGGN